jgi:hypothetical protein
MDAGGCTAASGCTARHKACHGVACCRQVCKLLQQVIQVMFCYCHAVLQVLSLLTTADRSIVLYNWYHESSDGHHIRHVCHEAGGPTFDFFVSTFSVMLFRSSPAIRSYVCHEGTRIHIF